MQDSQDDISRLIGVSRLVLSHLEKAIQTGCEGEHELEDRFYEKLFGVKSSYVDILVDIAGLLLKLEQSNNISHELHASQPAKEIQIEDDDIVIIKDFISRQKD